MPRRTWADKSKPARKTGVAGCSSFSWAMEPEPILSARDFGGEVIEDEYGRLYTLDAFRDVLLECPVQFRNVGVWFS